MSTDYVIQTHGPYLRVVLPDVEADRDGVWEAIEFELEDGIAWAQVIAPCSEDETSLAGVRRLVALLEQRGIDAVVEWQGVPERELVTVARRSWF
jgi:hypothetical protein